MARFSGRTDNIRCVFPGCKDVGLHRHHITYDPDVIVTLCERHHEDITIVNGQQARKYKRPLTDRWRWWIWHQWLEGNLKPRRTAKAMDYIEDLALGENSPR